MSEEEKKAIEELKEAISRPVEVSENKFNTFILYNIENAKIILNLVEKQQKELDKKDKVINLMSECIYDNDNFYKLKCAFEKIEKRKRT